LTLSNNVQRLVQLTAAPSCLVLELTRTSDWILCSYNATMFPTIVVSRLLLLLLLLLFIVVVVVVVVVAAAAVCSMLLKKTKGEKKKKSSGIN